MKALTQVLDADRIGSFINRWVRDNPFIQFTPTDNQARFLAHMEKKGLFGGAAGGGKSVAQMMAALMFVEIGYYNAILFRRTYPQLEKPDSLIPLSKEMLMGTEADWNQKHSRWTFPSGATLTLSHMQYEGDKYDHKSAQYQYIGFDEASEFHTSQIQYLFSRLRKSSDNPVPLRFRLTTNPGGPAHNHIRDEYVQSEDSDTFFLPSKLEDNPYINTEQYEKNLQELPPVERRRLRHGDWDVQAEGELFERHWFDYVDSLPDIEKTVRHWDMADSEAGNYTAGVKIGKRKDKVEYYIMDVARFRATSGEKVERIKSVARRDKRSVHPTPEIGIEQEGGSGGKYQAEDIRSQLSGYSTYSHRPTGSKVDRAGPLQSQFDLGNIYLLDGGWNGDFTDELALFPEGEYDDQVDAASGAFNRLHVDNSQKTVGTI